MTRLPPTYPHQVVADWIAANDVHVLTDAVERRSRGIARVEGLSPLDYDVCARRARKMQAEAIAAVGTAIGRVVSNTIDSLCDRWRTRRQIERLSYLTPRLLDDIGVPHDIQVRIRDLKAHRQPHRFHLHF